MHIKQKNSLIQRFWTYYIVTFNLVKLDLQLHRYNSDLQSR